LAGFGITLLVICCQAWGWMSSLQGYSYDTRAALFQFIGEEPTQSLVHLHIDDTALGVIGGWPWPRSYMGRVIDELSLSEPKAIAFDFMFIEAQSHKALDGSDKVLTLTGEDEDGKFAKAIKNAGNVILPVRFEVHAANASEADVVGMLMGDLGLERSVLISRLGGAGLSKAAAWLAEEDGNYWKAFDDAASRRIDQEMAKADSGKLRTLREWRLRLLPNDDLKYTSNERVRRIERLLPKVEAARATYPFTWPEKGIRAPVMVADDVNPPILPLAREISGSGFVNAFVDGGVLRGQPLVINYHGHLYPQLGLSLAMKMLGVTGEQVKIEANRVVIVSAQGAIKIPTRRQWSKTFQQEVGTIMDIPWFGNERDGWKLLYQVKEGSGIKAGSPGSGAASTMPAAPTTGPVEEKIKPRDHQLSITKIWDIILLRETLKKNLKELDASLPGMLVLVDRDALDAYTGKTFGDEEVASRLAFVKSAMEKARDSTFAEYAKLTDAKIDELTSDADERHAIKAFKTAFNGLPALVVEVEKSQQRIAAAREDVRGLLQGRAVMIGWVATGALADVVQTSVHSTMPGVIAHGVIYNAIMTRSFWHSLPDWVELLVTGLMGVTMTLLVYRLQPAAAVVAMVVLGGSYFLLNGLVVFDYGNTLLDMAGPLVAIMLVWAIGTLVKVLDEVRERRRITARFRSYVDPSLVQYVIDHPLEEVMKGQKREMTVVFTDLAGFTTISEILQEKTVEILNEYIDLVVPIIKEKNGLVNKFLGDGVMFFYGAPEPNPEHALCAVETVLRLQEALVGFNEGLKKRGLPTVKMRAGVATGPMIVGDAGGRGRSDYTVLGDTVNTSARLESANKATGSLMMVNQRVVDMVPAGMFLFRPMAKLTVVGKSKPVMVYEPIGYMDRANVAQLKYVESTTLMVEAFVKGEFAQCIKHAESIERFAGGDKLTNTYKSLSEKYMAQGLPLGFEGQIVLAEK
jgi:class 3 adenylate cyclase